MSEQDLGGSEGDAEERAGAEPEKPVPSGLLVIDKRLGLTSMSVCAVVRGKLRSGGAPKRIKVGHGGTLDPLATGVLVVLVGKATRKCTQVMEGEKRYIAEVDLSRTSTTDDLEGKITEIPAPLIPSREEIEAACLPFLGWKRQRPPAHSAMKIGGVRAYKLARLGEEPEMKPRFVEIIDIGVLEYAWPVVKLDVRCGKGTYIRSLARDLGQALPGPLGGMLVSLRRTAVGRWTIEQAATLDQLPKVLRQEDLLPVPEE
jgi:tRNA pseudouridine55 synthase